MTARNMLEQEIFERLVDAGLDEDEADTTARELATPPDGLCGIDGCVYYQHDDDVHSWDNA